MVAAAMGVRAGADARGPDTAAAGLPLGRELA
jgi:hypothetical protein